MVTRIKMTEYRELLQRERGIHVKGFMAKIKLFHFNLDDRCTGLSHLSEQFKIVDEHILPNTNDEHWEKVKNEIDNAYTLKNWTQMELEIRLCYY